MPITTEEATLGDTEVLVDLIFEIEQYYGATDFESVEVATRNIEALLTDANSGMVVLAKDGDFTIGLVSYSLLWPAAGTTRSLFIKELYVRPDYRRKGVGRELMNRALAYAASKGCSRVDWTLDRSNAHAAQSFYEQLGARANHDKVVYMIPTTPDSV